MLQISQRRCPALLQHCAAHPAQPWPAQLLGGRQPCQIRRPLSQQASAATCTSRPRHVCAVSRQQPAAAAGSEGSSDMANSSMASSSTNGSRQRLRRSTRSAAASQLPSRTDQPSGGTSFSSEDSDASSSSSSSSSSNTASRQLGLQLLQPGPALPRPLGSLLLQQPQPPLGFAASVWRQQQQWQQQWLPRQSPQPGSSVVAASAVALPREACVSSADGDEEAEWQLLLQLGELLDEAGMELPALRFGQQRAVCPVCGGGSSGEESFAINLDPHGSAVWVCHRATCGVRGVVRATRHARAPTSTGRRWPSSSSGSSSGASKQPAELSDAVARLRPLSSELLAWFAGRGISEATLQRNRVAADWRFCRGLGRLAEHIAFPFYREGRVVNVKYRALPKHFSQVRGGEQVFYGLDDALGAQEVIIVEGELDKLAIEEATGSTAVLSIPAGAAAPTTTSSSSSSSSSFSSGRKFAFVDQAAPILAGVSRVIVAVDGDEAGLNTALELGRRLGVERCSHVAWPSATVGGRDALELVAAVAADQGVAFDAAAAAQCKDANDMLMRCGQEALRLYLAHAPLRFAPPSA